MDKNTLEGNWKQIKGKIQERWGELTDDDLDMIGGKREQLVGRIQERYGQSKEEVLKDLGEWESRQFNRPNI